MIEDLLDHRRVFNAGNHLHRVGALATGLNVDIKYTLEALSQVIDARRSAGDGRSSTTLALLPLPRFWGCHQRSVLVAVKVVLLSERRAERWG